MKIAHLKNLRTRDYIVALKMDDESPLEFILQELTDRLQIVSVEDDVATIKGYGPNDSYWAIEWSAAVWSRVRGLVTASVAGTHCNRNINVSLCDLRRYTLKRFDEHVECLLYARSDDTKGVGLLAPLNTHTVLEGRAWVLFAIGQEPDTGIDSQKIFGFDGMAWCEIADTHVVADSPYESLIKLETPEWATSVTDTVPLTMAVFNSGDNDTFNKVYWAARRIITR